MPDPTQLPQQFQQQYQLSTATVNTYMALPDFFKKTFDSFGTGSTTEPPAQSDPPVVDTTSLVAFNGVSLADYQALAASLNTAFSELKATDIKLAPLFKAQAAISQQGQQALNTIIGNINDSAKTLPTGMTEDAHVLGFLGSVSTDGSAVITAASAQTADTTDQVTAMQKELDAKLAALQSKVSSFNPPSVPTPPVAPGPPGTAPGPQAPGPSPPLGLPPITPPAAITPTGLTGATTTGGPTDPNGASSINPSSVQPASMTTPSPAASPDSGLSSMMPLLDSMMNPASQRLQADDPSRDGDPNDPNQDRYQQDPQPVTPVQAAPATTPAPATSPAPGTTPAAPTTTPPGQPDPSAGNPATSNQPTAQPVMPAPDADGLVSFTFDDGKTQKVSPIVWQALTAAYGNKTTTDAQLAYSGTTAKWSDNKQIGDKKDPSELMTGDVATWQNRVAIVRAMGSDSDQTLHVIVNGAVQPYNADKQDEMSDTAGAFGDFAGWAHPRGIEATGSNTNATDTAAPAPADPSTALPAVATPAG
ncbi:hypothetical protein [Nocardia sp. NBC_01327]|uniref:hypothetical protein n=1 Tax=Nocardia sp. NBC_01327 TaxID=2903593 RepID=UPI002E11B3AC|nr:hypothetical protein OG326_41755 [Nocardia sp. NBC_01327]